MSKIVSVVTARVRCEVFPCKQPAKYAIGPEGRRQLAFNVCEEHAKQILTDFLEILPEKVERSPKKAVAQEVEPELKLRAEPEPEAEPLEGVYTCKRCGAYFPKNPEGRTAYMRHCKDCIKSNT